MKTTNGAHKSHCGCNDCQAVRKNYWQNLHHQEAVKANAATTTKDDWAWLGQTLPKFGAFER